MERWPHEPSSTGLQTLLPFDHIQCWPGQFFSTWNQLELAWKGQPQLRNWLHRTDFWVYMWGIFLINNWCGNASPGQVVLGNIRKQAHRMEKGLKRLSALTALPTDLGSILSTHNSSQPSINSVPGNSVLFSGLHRHQTCMWHREIHANKALKP